MNSNNTVQTGNIWCDITDHLPNYILITNNENNQEKKENDQLPLIRLFSAKNVQKFKDQLSLLDWSAVYNCSDVNMAYKTFHELLNNCYEDSFPYIRLSRKRSKDKKWFTAGLKCSSHHKNRLYRKWLKSQSPEDKQRYKSYLKVYKQLLKKAETLYYKEHFDTRVNSVKQLWTNINHLLISNIKQKTHIQKLTVNNKVITNPRDISNSLNNYFCSVGESLAESLKSDNPLEFSKYCPSTSKCSMYCETIHCDEITKIIANFPNKKSPGLDGFTPKLLKEVSDDVAQPLTYIFNLSFSQGVVPDYLKQSKVIPLYKKGNKDIPGNYRPISLLSIFDKIMEKLMYNRLYSYLNNKKFFYNYQFGFRKNYSTTLALIEVIDSIYSHIDKHEFTIGIYLDLQKAFDSVNHKILFKKLYNNGVRGEVHAWFQSYLSDRKQTTLHSDVYSDFGIITCGVPQGSVLGPLLFLIYINDIQCAVTDAKVRLFADDTNLFIHGKSLGELEITANNTLKQLTQWMAANKLSINIDKTCYSIFSPKNKVEKDIKLSINNITIKM